MDLLDILKPMVNALGGDYPRQKREQRYHIANRFLKIAVKQIDAHQHDIARLSVCKDLASAAICICVLIPAGEYYKQRRAERIRHLPSFLDHALPSSRHKYST